MRPRIYNDEEISFLKEAVPGKSRSEVVQLFNAEFGRHLSIKQLASIMYRHQLYTGIKGRSKPYTLNKRGGFSEAERRFLLDTIPGRHRSETVALFNKTFSKPITLNQLKHFIKLNNIKTVRRAPYEKGTQPLTGFKKGEMRYPHYAFKKGQKPPNTRPIGDKHVGTDGYSLVKTGDNQWQAEHILLWESRYGTVPEGRVLIFADGNKSNISLDNLIMVSRKELGILSAYNLRSSNPDLQRAGITVAKIIAKIKSKKAVARENKGIIV